MSDGNQDFNMIDQKMRKLNKGHSIRLWVDGFDGSYHASISTNQDYDNLEGIIFNSDFYESSRIAVSEAMTWFRENIDMSQTDVMI